MSEIFEYKCPCCGGVIEFDSESQKMKCPYCDTEFDLETLKSYDEDLKSGQGEELNFSEASSEWQDGETDGLSVYVCNSCAGEIIADDTVAATKCPYCDNPVIIKGRLANDLRPDFVIPFKLDKEDAKKALMKHFKGKPLLPKVFKDENHIDEIKGVYVPFWLFDANADADIHYRATRVRVWNSSKYRHVETSFYSVIRSGSLEFSKVPVDGSSKMANELMESIEPFDFSEAVDFQTAYLSGYLAERYDVSAADSRPRAGERMKRSAEDAFRETVKGYSSVATQSSNIRVADGKAKYVLYPVWILNTTWNNEKYTFAMNGQTGKFVGNLPVDGKLFASNLFKYAAIAGAVTFLAQWLFNMLGGL